jgi:glycerol kinase
MAIVIALDAGTTGVRAFAVDEYGHGVGYRYREFTQHFPRPGWVEHDADEIWSAIVGTTAELIASLNQPVAAIGITDQRETIVAWDRRTGRPLHRAIVWQDRRTAARCEALAEAGHLPLVRRSTGLVLDPYFSGSKVEWLFTHGGVEPGPNVAVGTIDSWLLWHLTGGEVHATEPSNASRTMLFDIGTLGWSDELCELFGVPAHVLPEVRPSSGRFGVTHERSGLPVGIPISGIAGDQQAALFGQACFAPGDTKNTYGTGSFVLMNVGERCPEPVEGLLTTVAWSIPDAARTGSPGDGSPGEGSIGPGSIGSGSIGSRSMGAGVRTDYAFEGAIFSTGSAIQWLRDGLGIIDDAAEIGPLAATVDSTDDVYFVPAFTGLGSPWWDPYARGTLVGVTRGTTRAHLARAVVESMAYQTRDVVEAMAAHAGHSVSGLRADGGASVMDLLLQLQADQLGVPVRRPMVQETTALGAAYLAGLAEGVWSSTDDITANWALDAEFMPEPGGDAAHQRWLQAVAASRGWARPT